MPADPTCSEHTRRNTYFCFMCRFKCKLSSLKDTLCAIVRLLLSHMHAGLRHTKYGRETVKKRCRVAVKLASLLHWKQLQRHHAGESCYAWLCNACTPGNHNADLFWSRSTSIATCELTKAQPHRVAVQAQRRRGLTAARALHIYRATTCSSPHFPHP